MDIKDEIEQIEKQVEKAKTEAAKAEARRDAAKAELKKALQEAQERFDVTTLPELKEKVAELRESAAEALADLKKKTSGL